MDYARPSVAEFCNTVDCGYMVGRPLMALRKNEISRFMANSKCRLTHFVKF